MAYSTEKKLGILGGGQLGRMLIQAAIDFDIYIKAIDPDPSAPCKFIAHEFVNGDFKDYKTVMSFAEDCDVITIEIENVNLEALEDLEKQGKKVFPQPAILRKIKDKRIQKQFYADNQLPTAGFELTDNKDAVQKSSFELPFVNKLGEGGYDGRGVQLIRTNDDFQKAFEEPSLVEQMVDFEKELAVVVARSESGEITTFPVVEMVFHPEANLVEYLFAPAKINEELTQKATSLAKQTAECFGIVGLLAVEMFLTKNGEILINEVAPRPHNSGHHTLKANLVSQFEQHLRAILDLPLGDTSAVGPSAMVNLLGEEGHTGPANYEGMEDVLGLPGVHPFLYGKAITKPFRKMGHITVVDADFDKLKEKVNFVKQTLKVTSKNA
ncbi:5-(carboxyamino)imidazole ribonucleotide synthase [Jiulongibacter sediminis]|uniref:N5-carboxyaminoimidazole ribonucleotide synthase n=1 Tax=Jiulongibacter sediminis TaxID=1605367 RepID=A0A0P7BQN4_9BACT|nr:5-(carboxyamino)imidazole ribonucleotide synthase [Jiulongibacter sediminis]KPM49513.1 phosphoribosylaminoimidazole carboxylase [Jiulongibacter sediminis]TBX26556.1 phosphoribosylaminoimidazole carboxylase [Jiulongibacter sediminis]